VINSSFLKEKKLSTIIYSLEEISKAIKVYNKCLSLSHIRESAFKAKSLNMDISK
jgi:hypothetical protein